MTALTAEGNDYVRILRLDDPVLSEFRRRLITTLKKLSQSDDPEAQQFASEWLGFPLDLPNLARLRPVTNTRPEGVERSWYAKRERGELPDWY